MRIYEHNENNNSKQTKQTQIKRKKHLSKATYVFYTSYMYAFMAADKCTGLRLRYFYLEVSCVIMVAFGDEKNSENFQNRN